MRSFCFRQMRSRNSETSRSASTCWHRSVAFRSKRFGTERWRPTSVVSVYSLLGWMSCARTKGDGACKRQGGPAAIDAPGEGVSKTPVVGRPRTLARVGCAGCVSPRPAQRAVLSLQAAAHHRSRAARRQRHRHVGLESVCGSNRSTGHRGVCHAHGDRHRLGSHTRRRRAARGGRVRHDYVAGVPIFGTRCLALSQCLFAVAGAIWLGLLVPTQAAQQRIVRVFSEVLSELPADYRRLSRRWITLGSSPRCRCSRRCTS